MRGTVRIGSIDVGMLCNGASPFIYRSIFKQDFLKEVQKTEVDTDVITKMAFIMASQDEKSTAECMKLTMDDFLTWLEQFGGLDLLLAANEIFTLYKGQEVTTSDPKKEAV